MTNTSARVIKNTIFLYVRMGISLIVSFFTTRILLLALGVSDYGLFNVVAGTLAMLGFLSSSLSSATQRFICYIEGEHESSKTKRIFTNAVWLHIILALLICVVFVVTGIFFFYKIFNIPDGRQISAIIVYGSLIVSVVLSVIVAPYDAILNAHENMWFYSMLGILDVFLKLLIAVVVYYSSADRLLFYGILMSVETVIVIAITRKYCVSHYEECRDIRLKKDCSWDIMRKITSFAGWNTLNVSTGMFSAYGMNIVLNHYFGTMINTAMGIANQLSGAILGVSSNMTKALTPVLLKNEGSNNRLQTQVISYVGCKFSYLLFSIVCIPAFFYMPMIVNFWLGNYPEWTVLFCRLMIISTLIDQLFVFLYQTILAEGSVKTYSIVRSVFNSMPIFIAIIQFELQWSPYWVIIDWILFKVIIGGFTNMWFAVHNVGLSVVGWLKIVFLPCLRASLITGIVSFVSIEFIDKEGCFQFLKFIILLLLGVPVCYLFALTSMERKKIRCLIRS